MICVQNQMQLTTFPLSTLEQFELLVELSPLHVK